MHYSHQLGLLAAVTGQAAASVAMAGVNIAGCDFISGNNTVAELEYGLPAQACPTDVGPTQMQHFVENDGFNVFRIPATWQSFVNNDLIANVLDETFMEEYDTILGSCLSLGAHCIIDIHNYAHWWGEIINQGGPSGDSLAKTWSQLATRYAANESVIFGIMNEPHADDNGFDMYNWAGVLNQTVAAIREAGATTQYILLPGTVYANAGVFVDQSAPALSTVTNPDGSFDNLIYEVHQYFDDQGGKVTSCDTSSTAGFQSIFSSLGDYLRANNRMAFIGELGGGNTDSCVETVCAVLDTINSYADVYLGWTSWAAGEFATDYELSETPNGDNDQLLVSSCFVPKFHQ